MGLSLMQLLYSGKDFRLRFASRNGKQLRNVRDHFAANAPSTCSICTSKESSRRQTDYQLRVTCTEGLNEEIATQQIISAIQSTPNGLWGAATVNHYDARAKKWLDPLLGKLSYSHRPIRDDSAVILW